MKASELKARANALNEQLTNEKQAFKELTESVKFENNLTTNGLCKNYTFKAFLNCLKTLNKDGFELFQKEYNLNKYISLYFSDLQEYYNTCISKNRTLTIAVKGAFKLLDKKHLANVQAGTDYAKLLKEKQQVYAELRVIQAQQQAKAQEKKQARAKKQNVA